jgi:hypothetical protein
MAEDDLTSLSITFVAMVLLVLSVSFSVLVGEAGLRNFVRNHFTSLGQVDRIQSEQ